MSLFAGGHPKTRKALCVVASLGTRRNSLQARSEQEVFHQSEAGPIPGITMWIFGYRPRWAATLAFLVDYLADL